MLHQEAVQTPRSRCGVVVLAMLLLVAIGIGRHRGGVATTEKEKSPYKTARHLEDCILSETQAWHFFSEPKSKQF